MISWLLMTPLERDRRRRLIDNKKDVKFVFRQYWVLSVFARSGFYVNDLIDGNRWWSGFRHKANHRSQLAIGKMSPMMIKLVGRTAQLRSRNTRSKASTADHERIKEDKSSNRSNSIDSKSKFVCLSNFFSFRRESNFKMSSLPSWSLKCPKLNKVTPTPR